MIPKKSKKMWFYRLKSMLSH